jgi:hypothetical protein
MILQRVCLAFAVIVVFASGLELVLDDAGKHIRSGAAWTRAEGDCAQAGHLGGFHHNNGVHDDESFAVWNFSIPKNGCYWVEEFHPDTSECGFSLSSRVPLHIHFCKGLHTAGVIDQSQRAGQWNRLVRLPFYTSHSAAIHISAMGLDFEASGVWAADAFRLTWDAEDCHEEEQEEEELGENEESESSKAGTKPMVQSLQAVVDDVDAEILGSSTEPMWQCPATVGKSFHHDGGEKTQHAKATFHFDPPHDGCYLVEQMNPQLEHCYASPNTRVHVNYCKGLEAFGKVDQSQNQGQWTFLAALPFFAGHRGNVTLSNEGTMPGTLALFDQVRFTWSGKSCRKADAHPRKAEIRMSVDFKNVADRLPEFAGTLKAKLAEWASVSEKSLRLVDLRPGSIIAEFLVMPSIVGDPFMPGLSASQIVARLQDAIAQNSKALCALTGPEVKDCNIDFKDLGVAEARVSSKTEKQTTQQKKQCTCKPGNNRFARMNRAIPSTEPLIFASICVGLSAGLCSLVGFLMWMKCRKNRKEASVPARAADNTFDNAMSASMEEGQLDPEKKAVEDLSDNNSTITPVSDKVSETSICGDIEGDVETSEAKADDQKSKPVLTVLRALSDNSI